MSLCYWIVFYLIFLFICFRCKINVCTVCKPNLYEKANACRFEAYITKELVKYNLTPFRCCKNSGEEFKKKYKKRCKKRGVQKISQNRCTIIFERLLIMSRFLVVLVIYLFKLGSSQFVCIPIITIIKCIFVYI